LVAVGSCCNNSWYNWYQNYLNNLTSTTKRPTTTTTTPTPSCKCGVPNRVTKIVGGETTEENEYPWQVGITFSSTGSPFCGGSIVSSKTIVTAAHCIKPYVNYNMYALVAEHDLTKSDGEKYIKVCNKDYHSSYNDQTFDYDYAVLTLCEELEWAKDIAPVCLPETSGQGTQYENIDSVISGWGTTTAGGSTSNILLEITVKSLSNSGCCSGDYQYPCSMITDRMICGAASGKDACQGDSGGPFIAKEGSSYTLTGIVSWGYGCAKPNYPGVYARVTNQLDWIKTRIEGTTCSRA